MQYVFNPERVCAKVFMIEVDDASRVITNFEFKGGCPGNLHGISRLVRGMALEEVISRFENMPICPSSKVTSCPEQFRKALLEIKALLDSGKEPVRPTLGLASFASLQK